MVEGIFKDNGAFPVILKTIDLILSWFASQLGVWMREVVREAFAHFGKRLVQVVSDLPHSHGSGSCLSSHVQIWIALATAQLFMGPGSGKHHEAASRRTRAGTRCVFGER
jgi:hypothetical protein